MFTAPDITENNVTLLSLNGSHRLNDLLLLSGTVYRRRNDTSSFNGDASEFELCEFSGGNRVLLEEPEDIEELLEVELGIDLGQICNGNFAEVIAVDPGGPGPGRLCAGGHQRCIEWKRFIGR